MNNADNLKIQKISKRISQKLYIPIYIVIFLFGVFLLIKAFGHQPIYEYDESFTYRIALVENWRDIFRILNNEQNFPFYYLILHILLKLSGTNLFIVTIFQFFIWVMTVFCFNLLVSKYLKNKNNVALITLLFTFTGSVWQYSMNLRPYGLLILFFMILLLIREYELRKKTTILYASTIILSVLALIHPISLIIICSDFILLFDKYKTKLVSNLENFFPGLIAITIILAQISQKIDPINIFFKDGVEYLGFYRINIFTFPMRLLIEQYYTISVFDYFIFIVSFSVIIIFFYKSLLSQKYRIIIIHNLLLIFFAVYSKLTIHHYFFLITSYYLALGVVIEKSKNLIKLFLITFFCAAVYSSFSNFKYYEQVPGLEVQNDEICYYLNTEFDDSTDIILTDHISLEYIRNCNFETEEYVIWNSSGFTKIDNINSEILMLQARYGGTIVPSNQSFKYYLDNIKPEEQLNNKQFLDEELTDYRRIIYILRYQYNIDQQNRIFEESGWKTKKTDYEFINIYTKLTNQSE